TRVEADTAQADESKAHDFHATSETPVAQVRQQVRQQQELDMSRIDALAAMLGITDTPAPTLDDASRVYVAGFISGLRSSQGEARGVPALPASAPLPASTRLWFDGVLAGLFSRTVPDASLPAIAQPAADSEPAVRIAHARPKVVLLWASQTGNVE